MKRPFAPHLRATDVLIPPLASAKGWEADLAPDDWREAASFVQPAAWRQCLVARSYLRRILAGHAAVSRRAPLGVDIERMRHIDAEWLANSWFSPREYGAWKQRSPRLRHTGFFRAWRRKEAFIKATRLGLAMPLHQFSVPVNPARAELLEIRGCGPGPWRMARLGAGGGCAAALVTFGDPGAIRIKEMA